MVGRQGSELAHLHCLSLTQTGLTSRTSATGPLGWASHEGHLERTFRIEAKKMALMQCLTTQARKRPKKLLLFHANQLSKVRFHNETAA